MFLSISRVVRIFGEYSFIIVFTSDSLLFLGFSFPSSPYRAVGPELYRTWRRKKVPWNVNATRTETA